MSAPREFQVDIAVPRSGSFQRTIFFDDIEGNPVDLTGADLIFETRYRPGDEDTITTAGEESDDDVTGVVRTDDAGGQWLLTVYGEDFAEVEGVHEVVRLHHKLRITKDGDPPLLLFGELILLPE